MSYLDLAGTILCRWILVSLVAAAGWVFVVRYFFRKDS